MTELSGAVAVVTGAASGLGFGLSARLVAAGARVAMIDIEGNALEAAVAGIGAPNATLPIVADVAVAAEVDAARVRVEESWGAARLLFANAGVGSPPLTTDEMPLSGWEWVLGVNLMGAVHCVRAFVPAMKASGTGHVITSCSLLGVSPGAGGAPYSVSKAALLALSLALHKELQPNGIHVSIVFPHVRSNIGSSRRNWPSRLGPDPWAGDDHVGQATSRYIEEGFPPEEIGELVLEGVRHQQLWIFPGTGPDVFDGILSPRWPRN